MFGEILGALSIVFALFLVLMVLSLAAVALIKAYNFVSEKAMPKPKAEIKTAPPATASGTGR